MNQELQESKEHLRAVEQPAHQEARETAEGDLSAETVATLYESRRKDLTALKYWVGLKFYYRAAEKIKQEEETLKRFLRIESAKQTVLADYSFVLDPAYFEQKFLT